MSRNLLETIAALSARSHPRFAWSMVRDAIVELRNAEPPDSVARARWDVVLNQHEAQRPSE